MSYEYINSALKELWRETMPVDAVTEAEAKAMAIRFSVDTYSALEEWNVLDVAIGHFGGNHDSAEVEEPLRKKCFALLNNPLPHARVEGALFVQVGTGGKRRHLVNEMLKGQLWAEELVNRAGFLPAGETASPEALAVTLMAYLAVATEESNRHFIDHLHEHFTATQWLESAEKLAASPQLNADSLHQSSDAAGKDRKQS